MHIKNSASDLCGGVLAYFFCATRNFSEISYGADIILNLHTLFPTDIFSVTEANLNGSIRVYINIDIKIPVSGTNIRADIMSQIQANL